MGVDPERRRPGSGIGEGDPRWRPARRGSRLHPQGPTAVPRSTRHVRASPRGPARGAGATPTHPTVRDRAPAACRGRAGWCAPADAAHRQPHHRRRGQRHRRLPGHRALAGPHRLRRPGPLRRVRGAGLPDRLAAGPGRRPRPVARQRRAPPPAERAAQLRRGGPDPAGRGHPGQRLLRGPGDLGGGADRLRRLPVPPGRPRAGRPPAPGRERAGAGRGHQPTPGGRAGHHHDRAPGPAGRSRPGRRRHHRPTGRPPGGPRRRDDPAGGRSSPR
jgi:hypothetical protein